MNYCVNPSCPNPTNVSEAKFCQTCGSKLLLHDRYRVVQKLGQGGFGATFLAQDEALPDHAKCVLKQLRANADQSGLLEMARELFEREANVLAKLNHPQLPDLLNYFELGNEFYLVQEYISGQNLQEEVKQNGVFTESKITEFLNEILPILNYVHNQNVIHRDIKPANIIRRREDQELVLIDFGAVKDQINPALATASETAALTSYAIGTPGYAPPEQMALRPVFASDIYALGMTCVYLLTGKSPKHLSYDSRTGEVLIHQSLEVSDRLVGILNRMMAALVSQRYQSVDQILEVLTEPQARLGQMQPTARTNPSAPTKGNVHQAAQPLNRESAPPPPDVDRVVGQRILLIEDETDIRETIAEILENEDFEVITAGDGEAGLQLARQQQPDLILCDVMMPKLDGYGVVAALQQDPATTTIPFIFLTARADKADMRQGMRLGADDYLTKPCTSAELIEAIVTRIGKRTALTQVYSDKEPSKTTDQIARETRLRQAIENAEFLLHYQPQVCLQTKRVVGVEALVRWYAPEQGMISPAEFIPLAETTGLIVPLGEWVLSTACAQAKAWQNAGVLPLRVAVNLSSFQFNQPDLSDKIVQILNETELDPHWLEIELTETLLVQNVESTVNRLSELKAIGVGVAIDDFGTGYASLGYLQHFPFDTLKIDQCFVRDLNQNSKNAAIATAIIQMARNLNLKTIAEGVETEAEKAFLYHQGCNEMQGYLFSRPLPANDLVNLLALKVTSAS